MNNTWDKKRPGSRKTIFKGFLNMFFMEFFLGPEHMVRGFFSLRLECILCNLMLFCYAFWYDLWRTECYFLSLNRFLSQ